MPIPIIEEHQQLCHYTTATGLHGILTSRQLWATHSSYLNDGEEITGFFDRKLPALLNSTVRSAIMKIAGGEPGSTEVKNAGGIESVVKNLTNEMHMAIRDATLSFNQVYVTSFCKVLKGNSADDGLLSQWRGYGTDGGYAIIFDTKKLEELLHVEQSRYHYQSFQIGDVQYHEHDENLATIHSETREWEDVLHKAILGFILTQKREKFEPVLAAVTSLSGMHKHFGFHEESEVRVLALPTNKELLKEARDGGDLRPRKNVSFYPRNGILVPHISLFEPFQNVEQPALPITKIIVGPHPEKKKRKAAIELLRDQLELDFDVTASDIPFLGH